MPPNPDDPRSVAGSAIRPRLSAEDRFARVVEASPTALVLVGHREMLSKLHTFEGAQNFYGNLFSLFDASPDHFLHLKDF